MKLIGLDVGTKRIGVAKADSQTKIAIPDGFVNVNGQEFAEIARIARMYSTSTFIIGLPRNNSGEETKQSLYARNFARQLAMSIPDARIYFEDESLTSVEAERRLKERKKNFQKGEIDAEAASIILQDFLERLITNGRIIENVYTSEQAKIESDTEARQVSEGKPAAKKVVNMNKKHGAPKKHHIGKIIAIVLAILVVLGGGGFAAAYFWYTNSIKAVAEKTCKFASAEEEAKSEEADDVLECKYIQFEVRDNDTSAVITKNLYNEGLIRSELAFKVYLKLNNPVLKSGIYDFRKTMTVEEIVAKLVEGAPADNVFNITVLPGETVADIKKKLLNYDYTEEQISEAFESVYSNKVLNGLYDPNGNLANVAQPRAVQLEGYVFGDTYQFYKEENLEKVLSTMINALGDVVEKNELEDKFKAQGLSLREGIILASIVQKEAKTEDMRGVAQVFLNRLRVGMSLGSDVTATYAADLIDPTRTTLTDNYAVLTHDSLYNTRVHTGLTPGPISNPGLPALLAVAEGDSTKRSMYYFLTGDDGKMYYSDTEAGHNQNIRDHCQILCGVAL
ncbi:endolytic transglycosylase MltG [Candidatus Saccharibacteria bacterium]|nr:endolytic transglycosylase MltG [Candidatus Saccharibacteria bacterium]